MDGSSCWALDASVLVNLLGTGRVREFLRVVPGACVTPAVRREVRRSPRSDCPDADPVAVLLGDGTLSLVELGPQAEELYLELLTAPRPDGLDDGEASTIAYAVGHGFACAIDERKGLRIARARFPNTPLATTYDIMRCGEKTLGRTALAASVRDAIAFSRMAVPPAEVDWVRDLAPDLEWLRRPRP